MLWHKRNIWVLILIALMATGVAIAHDTPTSHTPDHTADSNGGIERFESSSSQRRDIIRAIAANDLEGAADLLAEYLKTNADDAGMLYTAAGVNAQIGNIETAASYLRKSVEAGFREFDAMQRDPDLKPLRQHDVYLAIVEAHHRTSGFPGTDLFERWESKFGKGTYRLDRDDKRNLLYATSLDETSHAEIRAMLEKQADHLAETLFGGMPGYPVLIAIPTPAHAREALEHDNVGGLYIHHRRELITRDVGGSLRHEFMHVMHFGHMERLHQKHPLWIQEGLASLYEDYKLDFDGTIEFLPNDRLAEVKRQARGRRLPSWDELFRMDSKLFMREAAKMYAYVRSIFEFIADQGLLTDWYAAYVANFDSDTTGRKAFEEAFHMPIDQIERKWKAWVIARPDVATSVRPGSASLGIHYQPRAVSDGVLITRVLQDSAASRAGLRESDVIVAVDDEPTRSGQELTIRIAARKVGDFVMLRVRRDGRYLDIHATLQAYGSRNR